MEPNEGTESRDLRKSIPGRSRGFEVTGGAKRTPSTSVRAAGGLRLQGTLLFDVLESLHELLDGAARLGFMTPLAHQRAGRAWQRCQALGERFVDTLLKPANTAVRLRSVSVEQQELFQALAAGGGPEWVHFLLACEPAAADRTILECGAQDIQAILDNLHEVLDSVERAA